ncbi:MAG: hypothetical protein ACK5CF_13565, partial [Opitutaceae bacterium]
MTGDGSDPARGRVGFQAGADWWSAIGRRAGESAGRFWGKPCIALTELSDTVAAMWLLGIDGGGTQTRALIAGADGRVLGVG